MKRPLAAALLAAAVCGGAVTGFAVDTSHAAASRNIVVPLPVIGQVDSSAPDCITVTQNGQGKYLCIS